MYECMYVQICDEFLYFFANLTNFLTNAAQGREGLSQLIVRGDPVHGGRKAVRADMEGD